MDARSGSAAMIAAMGICAGLFGMGGIGLFAAAAAPAETAEKITVTVEGSAFFQRDLSLDEVRTKARDDARRNALERAVGVFVRGASVVYNSQIADDLVVSVSRGTIEDEQWLDERIEQPTSAESQPPQAVYRTKLVAVVRPIQVERRAGFEVHASLNKQVYQDGDEALIKVRTTESAYLHVFSVTSDGSVTLLVPNRFLSTNRVAAEQELLFPDERLKSVGVVLRVLLPKNAKKALEHIKVIATRKPVQLVADVSPQAVLQRFSGSETVMIRNVVKQLASLNDEDWAEVTVPYEIRP